MEKMQFAINISAPREKVWHVLWDHETYQQWTSVFDSGSRFEGALTEGNDVLFLGSSGAGMYANVAKVVPNEFMSFKHLGEIGPDGKKHPYGEDADVFENYTLTGKDGMTQVIVEVDMPAEHKDMFENMFPQALQKAKELAEK